MPRQKDRSWTSAGLTNTLSEVATAGGGNATFRGRQRFLDGQGLDPLVDPKTHGAIREARNFMTQQADGTWLLPFGVAIPVLTFIDGTASMMDNVERSLRALPRTKDLIVDNVLARYHVQIATGIVQDRIHNFPLQISEFEPDDEVHRQITLLHPEGPNDTTTEDYQNGIWYAGGRVEADINRHGLKGYLFFVGDERGRDHISRHDIQRICEVDERVDLTAEWAGKIALAKWHGFFLQIFDHDYTTEWWSNVFGRDRVVLVPRPEVIPEIQAVIMGLSEGVFDLEGARAFLAEHNISAAEASKIIRAVSHIPFRTQADLPGFEQIPSAGSVFASKEDLQPIGFDSSQEQDRPEREVAWQL